MTLRGNLFAAIVAAVVGLVLALALLERPLVERHETQRVRDELLTAADRALREIEAGGEPDAVADYVGATTASRITILDADGRVLGDTAHDGEALAGALAPVIDGTRHRVVETEGEVLYARVRGPGGTIARASRPVATIEGVHESTRELLVVAGIVGLLAILILTWALSRSIIVPIDRITTTADSIARGDLTVRIRSDRGDELGRLGRSLDHLADELSSRFREIREEEARLTTMLDSMVEAVFVTDPSGTIVLTNAALDKLVREPARGQTVVDAIESTVLHEAVWAAMRGQTTSVELDVSVRGRGMTIAAHVAPLPDDRGVVAVLHDVSDLKRADKIRRDFVANASHELRTPLTAIRGFAETLRGGAASDPETANRFLDTILRHTIRLQLLVDDLLALSRSESADTEFELGPIDVAPIVREAAGYLEANAQLKNIAVTLEGFDDVVAAQANEWAVDHIMVNLIDNAVKYTPKGGRVRVRGALDGERVVIEVSDTGPGIPANKQNRIFERFYRIDKGRSRDQGGTGLGLSIVKHLVQRMGGTIEVVSAPEEGTTFRVALPGASDQPTSPGIVEALDGGEGERERRATEDGQEADAAERPDPPAL
jgi:two-component system phosphate regulon sensor histidine kinase PhoR